MQQPQFLHPKKVEKDVRELDDLTLMRELRNYSALFNEAQKQLSVLNQEAERRLQAQEKVSGQKTATEKVKPAGGNKPTPAEQVKARRPRHNGKGMRGGKLK